MNEKLRNLAPLALLALGLFVWFEPIIPGADRFTGQFGDTALLRFVTGLLCFFVILLIYERKQLHELLQRLVGTLQQARAQQAGGAGAAAGAGGGGVDEAAARRDAMSILIAALESDDPEVKAKAAHNLQQLTGRKFGEDAGRWRAYLKAENGS